MASYLDRTLLQVPRSSAVNPGRRRPAMTDLPRRMRLPCSIFQSDRRSIFQSDHIFQQGTVCESRNPLAAATPDPCASRTGGLRSLASPRRVRRESATKRNMVVVCSEQWKYLSVRERTNVTRISYKRFSQCDLDRTKGITMFRTTVWIL